MKKIVTLIASFFVLFPVVVNAATVNYSQDYNLSDGEVVNDNLYNLSEDTDIEGIIEGDFFNASNRFVHTGTTTEDLFVVSGDAEVQNNVGGDLRIAGARIFIKNNIGGELLATGSEIILGEETNIVEDAIIASSKVNVQGNIGEDLQVYGQQVTIDGKISGNVDVKAQQVEIKENTEIAGNLNYSAKSEAQIPENAVQGTVNFSAEDMASVTTSVEDYFSRSWFVGLLVSLITVLVFFALFRVRSQEITNHTLNRFGKDSLLGLALIVTSPLILILLLSSMVGIWFGVILTALLVILLVLAKIGAAYLVAMIINKLLNKEEVLTWNNITIGVILIELLAFIPIVGWVIELLIYVTAFGGLSHQLYLKTKRFNK